MWRTAARDHGLDFFAAAAEETGTAGTVTHVSETVVPPHQSANGDPDSVIIEEGTVSSDDNDNGGNAAAKEGKIDYCLDGLLASR